MALLGFFYIEGKKLKKLLNIKVKRKKTIFNGQNREEERERKRGNKYQQLVDI